MDQSGPDAGGVGDARTAIEGAFDQSTRLQIVLAGPELRLVAANRAARAMVGDRPYGVPLREAFAEVVGQQVWEAYERCYQTTEPQRFEEWRVQLNGPDGDPIEVYADFSVTPWLGPDGRILGVVGEGTDVTARVLARQAAEAARDAATRELGEARLVVRTMQEAHLPRALPVLPRLDIAARYLFASEDSAAGGDWFDAIIRRDGRVILVVGDVVGHGTSASATMGQLRAVCHERLTHAPSVAAALADVDDFARGVPEARHATVCVVELDLVTGAGEYCTAGHPPPLLLRDGEPTYLPPTGAGPLATTGLFPAMPFQLLTEGSLVLLYTDGILERPGTTPASSTVELAASVADIAAGRGPVLGAPARMSERVCELALELMTRTTGYADDITMLAAGLTPAPPRLHVEAHAEPAIVTSVRDRLQEWLRPLDVAEVDRVALTHAVSELVANVVAHAYPEGSVTGSVTLDLALDDDGEVSLRVTDHGRWQDPPDPAGRGLQLVRAFLDELHLESGPHGTVASGRYRPSRPARLLTGAGPATGGSIRGDRPFTITGEVRSLKVSGPILAEQAEELAHQLGQLTAAGDPVVLDLTDVTHLGSPGVRTLHDFVTTDETPLTVIASNGSVAQHVLALVALPHRTSPPDQGAMP